MIGITQLTQTWGLKKGNEKIEIVVILKMAVVIGFHFCPGQAHKLIVNGSEVKATATVASRGTFMIRIVLRAFFIFLRIILSSAAIHLA